MVFPSLGRKRSCALAISNRSTRNGTIRGTINFRCGPHRMVLTSKVSNGIVIPTIARRFIRTSNGQVVRAGPLALDSNTIIANSCSIFTALHSSTGMPLIIGKIHVRPNRAVKVVDRRSFNTSNNHLDVPIGPTIPSIINSSDLLIVASTPGSPVLIISVGA